MALVKSIKRSKAKDNFSLKRNDKLYVEYSSQLTCNFAYGNS